MRAGPLDMVILSDPEDVRHFFSSKSFVDKPEIEAINYFRLHAKLANGLAFRYLYYQLNNANTDSSSSNGTTWERGRGIANKTLINPQIVQSFAGAMNQNADKVVAKWKKEGSGLKTVAPDLDAYATDSILFKFPSFLTGKVLSLSLTMILSDRQDCIRGGSESD